MTKDQRCDRVGTSLSASRLECPAVLDGKPLQRMDSKPGTNFFNSKNLAILAGWAVLLVAAVMAYWPGLEGPFLFDDFDAISSLGDRGGVVNWETFRIFVFGGVAGPTGRPISLLTFLIDANNWPAEAWPFKRTNLVIHLLNGVVLGVLTSSILKYLEYSRRDALRIALVATGIWLLHPFLVSTTLYIVQRMAQLATLFMFGGLVTYLYGRSFVASQPVKAYVVMSVSVAGFGLLAMLSKENGILLPILVGVVEFTVVASQRHRLPALNKYWVAVFIWLPMSVVFLYLGAKFFRSDFFEMVPPRDFSVFERLLTQGRVLVEYLQHWFLPKLYTTGVFQDHFIKSEGLFSPVTTILSIVFHVALIMVALIRRKQWPLFSLAVLFFYGSHLLESTVINLEMYFEHRNYIAAAFLFLPLVSLVNRKASVRVFGIAALCTLMLLGSFTRYSATVWSSLPSMIESSALKAPTSARAQAQWSKLLFVLGRYDQALETIDRAIENIPGDKPLLLTNRLYYLCNLDQLKSDDFDDVANRLSRVIFDSRSLKAYNVFTQEIVSGHCPNIELSRLESMYVQMLSVPRNGDPTTIEYSHVNFLIGYVRTFAGQPAAAVQAFMQSLRSRPGATHAMAMAALMASNNYPDEALQLADVALSQIDKGASAMSELQGGRVSEKDILEFMSTVREGLDAQ
jgi:tetratricopeptide (TPR) repeat protein